MARRPASPASARLAQSAQASWFARLVERGWTFAVDEKIAPASGVTDWVNRQIVFRPRVAVRRNLRDRAYVAAHEIGHAMDFDAGAPSLALGTILGLRWEAAREALAECAAYQNRRTAGERQWILGSIAWHARRQAKFRYRWRDVVHPETVALAQALSDRRDVEHWKWEGTTVTR